MRERTLEISVGLFMLAGIVALTMLAFTVSGFTDFIGTKGYLVIANFDTIGDLKPRAPVAVAGVRVGEVVDIDLDKKTYKAQVTMQISSKQDTLPKDTSASIYTQGLLGSNYISLSPGFDEANLKDGDVIQTTHPALILENLIGQLIFKLKDK